MSTSKKAAPPKAQAATTLLRADHKKVKSLFEAFESARGSKRKAALVAEICAELTVHAQIEEEIFYPAVVKALKDKEMVPEATVEHATLKDLIAQLESASPEDELYDAKVKVLAEYVEHHVKEEHSEMFPRANESKIDMFELGARMAARKAELTANPGRKG